MAKQIDIPVHLSAAAFRRYCAFDTFRRQRRWYAPVLIGMVLITLSLGGLLNLIPIGESAAGVLMGLGLAVPLVVFGLYVIQIETQVSRGGLKRAPLVYTLRLNADGVRVTGGGAPVSVPWDRLWAAFRRRDCIYLYVNPERALILPDGQGSASGDEIWQYLRKSMAPGRCIGPQ